MFRSDRVRSAALRMKLAPMEQLQSLRPTAEGHHALMHIMVVDFGLLHVLTHWAEGPTRPHHYASYLGSRTPSGGCPHVEFISVARLCVCQRQCFYRVLHRSMSPPGECVCVWLLCVYLSPMCKNITRITTSSTRSRVRGLSTCGPVSQ
jgi:hypothetical protein